MLSGVSACSSSLKSLPLITISRRSSFLVSSSNSLCSSSSSSSSLSSSFSERRGRFFFQLERRTKTSSISKEVVERIRSRAKASDISSSSGRNSSTSTRTEEKTPLTTAKKDLFRFNYEHDIRETQTMLPFNADKYGGVVVNSDEYDYKTDEEFTLALDESLESWKESNIRGCWVKVPIANASYVPIVVSRGFHFHHAEKEYVMLTKWLPENEENKLPAAATHHVGIGAFVTRINPTDENKRDVLMVQELRGPAAGRDLWKLPTGLLDVGEDVPEAAVREVMEETGVKAEFVSILSARHSHGTHFGRSDMFFVVALRALSDELIRCPKEIEKVEWKDLEFFANNPKVQEGTAMWALNKKCYEFAQGKMTGMQSDFYPAGMNRPKPVRVYFGEEKSSKL